MGFLNINIRFLRKNKGLTQEDLSKKIGVTRSIIGAYEEGRAEPKLQTLQNIAYYFGVNIDELLNTDLSTQKSDKKAIDVEGKGLRVLPVIVNTDNNEFITVVPIKAAAGYLNGYADSEHIEKLNRFNLPLAEISSNSTYRLFQIKGDSMTPIMPGSYVITEYIDNWREVKDNKCYVLLTKDDGIVYKRILNRITENNEFILKSDNPLYEAYSITTDNILEVWKAVGYISFELPSVEDLSLDKLSSIVMQLKKDVNKLKNSSDE